MLAALAAVLVLLASKYADFSALFLTGMERKRATYAAELIKDALYGCPDVEMHLHFPYEVRVECGEDRVYVGKGWAEIPRCSGGGKGTDVVVKKCSVRVT